MRDNCYGFSSCLRFIGGRFGLFWLKKLNRNSDLFAHARAQNTIGNACRKMVGPLVDGLVRNAQRLCSGGHFTSQ